MAEIEVSDGTLICNVTGWDRIWALKSRLEIPLPHVQSVEVNPEIARGSKGFKAPGTHVPGVVTAGTFYRDGNRVFWDVHNPDKAIVINLRDQHYARLVVEVENPEDTVTKVGEALSRQQLASASSSEWS